MKILMTADTVGGVFTYAVELCRGLAPLGVEVCLATQGAPLSDAQRRTLSALPNVSVRESSYKLEWQESPWEEVSAAGEWLMDLARLLQPDVVHLNGYAHGQLPFPAPKLVVAHSCVASWFAHVRGTPLPGEWERYRREVSAGLNAADETVAVSHAMADAIAAHYDVERSCKVIYNGRTATFAPRAQGEKEPFILTAGRLWDDAKNVRAVESAAAGLPWPAYVAGDWGNAPLSPAPNVRRLGVLPPEQMQDMFQRAAIYALPAYYEPFGLSVLEAAQAGCALVLGDIASLRELWDGAARFVPPGDVDALRAALHALAEAPAERESLAARAHARAQTFTSERMALDYHELYQALVRRASTHPRPGDVACAS